MRQVVAVPLSRVGGHRLLAGQHARSLAAERESTRGSGTLGGFPV